MQWLSNRYLKAAAIGLLTLLIARVIIAIISSYVGEDVPFPWVLSLIAGGTFYWLTLRAIRF